MLKNIFKVGVVLVLVILSFTTFNTAKAETNDSDSALKTASALVGFAPHYVAPGVKLVSVENPSQNTVQYTYVLEQVDRNSPQLKNISQNLKAALIEDFKKHEDIEVLREHKINLIFIYKDIKNVQLFRVVLNHGEY